MNDKKISKLDILAAPDAGDLLAIVDRQASPFASRSTTVANLLGASFITLGASLLMTNERILTGTANQIVVTDGGAGGNVVLSTPQDIAVSSTPVFAGLGIGTIPDAKIQIGINTDVGTGIISSVGTTVTGVGTAFLSELSVGTFIFPDGGGNASIASIASDTSLTVVFAFAPAIVGESFTYRLPAIRARFFMVDQQGNMSLGEDFAPEGDFHLRENSIHVVNAIIENKYAVNASAPTETVYSRHALAPSQIARVGMDHIGRDFFIRVAGSDRINVDSNGNITLTGKPSITIANIAEGLINFIGNDRGVIVGATASVESVRVELGGVVRRLALYADA